MTGDDKQRLRRQAVEARRRQADKDAISREVIDRVVSLPAYVAAETALWYVDVRDEVRTKHALPAALSSGKSIAVPYCVGQELSLFRLESMDELASGRFGIREPRAELRETPAKTVPNSELDVILVPGVAFDRLGNRLGHGQGFYDRLLSELPAQVRKLGIAFDCQIIESIPAEPHDVAMDFVVTESRCIDVIQSSSE